MWSLYVQTREAYTGILRSFYIGTKKTPTCDTLTPKDDVYIFWPFIARKICTFCEPIWGSIII